MAEPKPKLVGSSPPATAASSACSIARTTARTRRRGRHALPGGAGAPSETTISRWSRSRSPPPGRRRSSRCSIFARYLVTMRACATAGGSPACATFADREEFVIRRLRNPRVHLDAGSADTTSGGRLRAAGLPDQQTPAPGGNRRLPRRAARKHAHLQHLHRVQAARQHLRDGRPRDPLPGPVARPAAGAVCPSYKPSLHYGRWRAPTRRPAGWMRGQPRVGRA